MNMDRKKCRFYRNGYCLAEYCKCHGYTDECGDAEDMDDVESSYYEIEEW